MTQRRELLHVMLDVGEQMLNAGAEIHRIEDTLSRIGEAYGACRTNIFVITSSIVITLEFRDGDIQTQSRRIAKGADTDFKKLEALNQLSRKCCQNTLSVKALREEVQRIDVPASNMELFLGSVIAAGSFTLFFGGSLWDAAVSVCFALCICFMQIYLSRLCPNRVVFQVLCAFLSGIGICILCRILPFLHMDKIMIGDIMLLIPGIALTNSIRDVLAGDTISGVMRLIESLIWSGALAGGFMMAILVTGM